MIYSNSCKTFLEEAEDDLLEKFVAERTGRNYELAMQIKQNVNEWIRQRRNNTESK